MLLFAVIITSLLFLFSAAKYVKLTWRYEIDPTPATWAMMLVFFSLSAWMYWMTPEHSLEGNIGNLAGLVNVFIIFAGVIGLHLRDKTLSVAFDSFQKKCLIMGALIVTFWFVTREGEVAYILTQVLALVAYIPMVRRLWTAKKPTEPFFLWSLALIACFASLYPAIVLKDKLAWIFLGRAIPSSILVMALIKRSERSLSRLVFPPPPTDT